MLSFLCVKWKCILPLFYFDFFTLIVPSRSMFEYFIHLELAVSWSLLQHCTFTQCLSCLILDFTITLREWYYNHHLHKNSLANGIYSPRFIIYNFFLFFALMVVWGLVVGVSDRVFGVGVFSLRGLEPVV